jgi:phenylalanyl-tRNA synthetase beta chain
MQFSEAWLREWVDPNVTTEELSDQLSMAGLEVESVQPVAPEFNGVVVGTVLSKEQHPDADKLSVCGVDVGGEEQLQIVCGAKNVAANMKVPVAIVGARLPGDFRIKKAKLRGVQSMGMICSASELGLADSSDGIMPLPLDAPVGADFRDYLALDDVCIDVDLTPDRGDCLSVAGIARDVGVLYRSPLTPPAIEPVPATIENRMEAKLEAPGDCPRYCCRVIKGINPQAATPRWMTEKLRRGGIRPISPVVDVTNYVMLELGQPMHGFDLARLEGEIHVRQAQAGEQITLLDGSELEIQAGTLLIADLDKPLAIAGIMGGESSAVSEQTTDILLESAFFKPTAIIGKARSYGLHTDSSHRFERGVDFQLQMTALERASALLQEIAGGAMGPVVESVSEQHLPLIKSIHLRRAQVARILGVEISDQDIEDILQRLGMTLVQVEDGWNVVAPSARFDVAIEADLLEEIGRIYGYDNIPENLTAAHVTLTSKPETDFNLDRAKELLVSRGYQEVITYSFISPEMTDLISPKMPRIELANPISADMSLMRSSLWPGLLSTLQYNLARQQDRVRLFESGLRFTKSDAGIQQKPMLSGLINGILHPEQWAETSHKVDFYDVKGDVENILTLTGSSEDFSFTQVEDAALHPGQAAAILYRGKEIGRLGLLHPAVQNKLDLPGSVYLFELQLDGLAQMGKLPAFQPLSKFPAIRRDLALLLDKNLSFSAVEACARRAAPEIVRDIRVFDVYTGENIDSNVKSLALSLILQDSSHTLTDKEVESATQVILDTLESELSASLRD